MMAAAALNQTTAAALLLGRMRQKREVRLHPLGQRFTEDTSVMISNVQNALPTNNTDSDPMSTQQNYSMKYPIDNKDDTFSRSSHTTLVVDEKRIDDNQKEHDITKEPATTIYSGSLACLQLFLCKIGKYVFYESDETTSLMLKILR